MINYPSLIIKLVLSTFPSPMLQQNQDLVRHCKVLSNFSKNPSKPNIQLAIKSIAALASSKSIIDIQFQGFIKCFICKRTGGEIASINCNHVVHPECFKSRARMVSKDTFSPELLEKLHCDTCNKVISYQECAKVIGRKVIEEYHFKASMIAAEHIKEEEKKARKELLKNMSFECSLCLERVAFDDAITMSCDQNHRFCKDCAKGMILQQIAEGKFQPGSIKCGAEGCDGPLDELLIKHCLEEDQFQKYMNLQYKNLKVEGLMIRPCNGYVYKDGEHLVRIKQGLEKKEYETLQDELERKCNSIQSGNVAAAQLNREVMPCTAIVSFDPVNNEQGGILQCLICGLDGCIKGCSSAHRGNTCEKYKEWEAINKKGQELSIEEIRAQGMAQCPNPKCKVPILRNGGCNWVKCRCGFELCYPCSRAWTRQDPHVAGGGHPPFDVQKFLRENP